MFCKNSVLRNLTKFTWKHLCQSLFFNQVAVLMRLNAAILYQASDYNNWERWEILLYVFIILSGRFSFKFNFIPGWNSTRFIPEWNSRVNRNFFIQGRVSSQDEISSRLHVNALLIALQKCECVFLSEDNICLTYNCRILSIVNWKKQQQQQKNRISFLRHN